MFSFAIGRPLVRWADLPGRVVASPPCHAASGRLIANTGLLAGNGRPHRLDDALMLPCCGSDRLIILKGLKPGIDRSLSYLPHTHTHTHAQGRLGRANGSVTEAWVLSGYQGRIREGSGAYQVAQ